MPHQITLIFYHPSLKIQNQMCLTGGQGCHVLKSVLGVGALSMSFVILPYIQGVSLSSSSRLRRYSMSCSTFLGPMTTEFRYWYLMVQARAKCMSLYPISSAIALIFTRFSLFLGVSMGSQKNSLYLANWGKLYLAVSSCFSYKYLPVRYPPARGLQAIRPYLYSFIKLRYSNSASSRLSILQQFCAPMGRCRFIFSQIAKAYMTHSAGQLEVAQQKLIPASITSWKPRQIYSTGVQSSKRWAQTTSTQSSCRRERHAFKPYLMCLRLIAIREFISASGAERILVEMTTSSLGTPRDFRIVPNCVSAFPAEYISAVSKWLIPLARQALMSSSSLARPSLAKLRSCPIVITETFSPELPKQRYSIRSGFKVDIGLQCISYNHGVLWMIRGDWMGHLWLLIGILMDFRALSVLIQSCSVIQNESAFVQGSSQ